MQRSRLFTLGLGFGVVVSLLLGSVGDPPLAQATTTFTVNSTADGTDATPGNTVCETATGNGVCTLRAAITEANALAGTDTINFAIAPTGSIKTISPLTANGALPPLTEKTTIAGGTQTGGVYGGIELSGLSCSGCAWGLAISGGVNSTIKGMVVNDFVGGTGILIGAPSSANVIRENLIGTNSSAGLAKPNAAGVVVAASSLNSIGPNNTISGNTLYGVRIVSCFLPYVACGDANGNDILLNAIGTNGCCTYAVPNGIGVEILGASGWSATMNRVGVEPSSGNTIAGNTGAGVRIVSAGGNSVGPGPIGFSGTSAIANGGAGIEIDGTALPSASLNTIGCATPMCGGIGIGGNTSHGVYIHGPYAGYNTIAHASIGESCPVSCASPIAIPNGGHGVYISDGAHHNDVGGLVPNDTGNDIGYNAGAGVAVGSGGFNRILGTTIHDNGGLGIDVAPIAPIGTPQTPAAFAPYITPAFPGALTSALYCPGCLGGGLLAVTGYMRGAPPGEYNVGLFRNLTCDPSGYGEAALPLLGAWYVPPSAITTDAFGNLSGAGALLGAASMVGQFLAANSTRITPLAASSEYGKCLIVTLDSDSDGIENSVDPATLVPGDCFSDVPLGGTTFGCITARAGCYVSVSDRPLPYGVVIGSVCPFTPLSNALVSMCGFGTFKVPDGGSAENTCGSFRSGVAVGPTDFTFGSVNYVARMNTNTEGEVQAIGNDGFVVFNKAASAVPNTVTFGPKPFVVTLPPDTTVSLQVNWPQALVEVTNITQNLAAPPIVVDGSNLVKDATTNLALPGPAVGGVSEAPDAAALPSAASRPDGRSALLVASAALGLAALAMVAGLRLRRRSSAG